MGKLHKIKQAFDRLPHETKYTMEQKMAYGTRYGCVYRNGVWQFCLFCTSYRNYVTKLVKQYCKKWRSENRHVFERAYLAGDVQAIAEFKKLYEDTGDSS